MNALLFERLSRFPDDLERTRYSVLRATLARTSPQRALEVDRVLVRHRAQLRSLVEFDGEKWLSRFDVRVLASWIAAAERVERRELERVLLEDEGGAR